MRLRFRCGGLAILSSLTLIVCISCFATLHISGRHGHGDDELKLLESRIDVMRKLVAAAEDGGSFLSRAEALASFYEIKNWMMAEYHKKVAIQKSRVAQSACDFFEPALKDLIDRSTNDVGRVFRDEGPLAPDPLEWCTEKPKQISSEHENYHKSCGNYNEMILPTTTTTPRIGNLYDEAESFKEMALALREELEGLMGPPPIDAPIFNVSLVVPVTAKDLRDIWKSLESIRHQSLVPAEVIVTISGLAEKSSYGSISSWVVVMKELMEDVPTKMRFIGADEKCKAGNNRHMGFEYSNYDLISFFDSDDFMHPDYMAILQELFEFYPTMDFILPNSLFIVLNTTQPFETMAAIDTYLKANPRLKQYNPRLTVNFESSRALLPRYQSPWYLGIGPEGEPHVKVTAGGSVDWYYPAMNAWATAKRHVFEEVHQLTSKPYAEDSIFTYRVIASGFNVGAMHHFPLGAYVYRHKAQSNPNQIWNGDDNTTTAPKIQKAEQQPTPPPPHEVAPPPPLRSSNSTPNC